MSDQPDSLPRQGPESGAVDVHYSDESALHSTRRRDEARDNALEASESTHDKTRYSLHLT